MKNVQVDQDIRAISTINGSNNISGVIYFTQTTPPAGSVTIRGVIRGLKPGKHSIHINQMGDLRNSCLSTGGHYNPYNVNLARNSLEKCCFIKFYHLQFTHGPPFVRQRHVGDLGNIQVNQDGSADFTLVDKMLTLVGSRSIIGRSVVIDEGEDDLGKIRTSASTKTGNSGSPVACGVSGRLE